MVYNLSFNYIQNTEDAEEITQDVFIQLHYLLSDFKEKSSSETWNYLISINKFFDYIKKKQSKKVLVFGKKSDNQAEYTTIYTFEHPGII